MKRFTVLVVAVLAVAAMLGTAAGAEASNFSGKWINYLMVTLPGSRTPSSTGR